jgi:glycosyltransferase involved in cell wall biosynthesis
MRLAILGTRGIPARYGGFETFAEQLSIRLARSGVNVTVFCPTDSHKCDEAYRGVTLRYVSPPSLGRLSDLAWDLKCFWKSRRGFDLVYMLGVGASFAAWVPRLFGTIVWINTDGIEWKRSKWTPLERLYLALAEAMSVLFASRIIADATAIAEYLRRRYPGIKRIATIAYGAEIPSVEPNRDSLEEWGLKTGGYYLVVCRLEPENHVHEIIEGFSKADSALPLVILGNTKNPNEYVQRLLSYQSSRIRFLGTIYDKDELGSIRYYARAYLHGHSVGGTNPSLLEALACSNLVIAHDNPFNREVLGSSGLYFTTREELATTINAVDEGRVDADVRRQRSKEIISARYHWDQVCDAYFDLLSDDVDADRTAIHGNNESGITPPSSSF